MSSAETWQWWLAAAVFFGAGWSWGQWWTERSIRREREAAAKGVMTVSLPVHPDRAAKLLRMLSDLMRLAEAEERQGDTK
jgi:hypothetical protein